MKLDLIAGPASRGGEEASNVRAPRSEERRIGSVAVVHNLYGSASPSGENVTSDAECELLEAGGLTVYRHSRWNDSFKTMRPWQWAAAACQTPWSVATYFDMRRFLARHRPDVVHIHNTFPLISYSVADACHDAGIPCVATIHNYRFICASGLFLRDGQICEDCLESDSILPGLTHKCYRNSLAATLPVSMAIALNRARGLWARRLSAIIALTRFQKERLVGIGAPPDKVFVKPNFVRTPPAPLAWAGREPAFLFVGRLSVEKGVRLLMDVWRRVGDAACKLVMIGDGPLRSELERERLPNVEFLGQRSRSEVLQHVRRARALVFPSIWAEGFPLSIVEALSCGVPVIASRIGGIPEIVDQGVVGDLVTPGDPDAWCESILRYSRSPDILESMGENALLKYEAQYSPEKNLEMLRKIYKNALSAVPRQEPFPASDQSCL